MQLNIAILLNSPTQALQTYATAITKQRAHSQKALYVHISTCNNGGRPPRCKSAHGTPKFIQPLSLESHRKRGLSENIGFSQSIFVFHRISEDKVEVAVAITVAVLVVLEVVPLLAIVVVVVVVVVILFYIIPLLDVYLCFYLH